MNKLKTITLRVPISEWRFLRDKTTDQESSINAILRDYIQNDQKNYKKNYKKDLTQDAIMT